MRRTILLAGVLLSVVALGSDSPKEYDGRTETVAIEGTWRLTEVEYSGTKTLTAVPVEVTIIRGGTYTSNYGGGDTVQGSYRIDNSCKPAHLNRFPSFGRFKNQMIKDIYQLDGDTLRIAERLAPNDLRRPQGFNDEGVYTYIYKRVK